MAAIAADQFMKIVAWQELARAGSGGVIGEPDEPHYRLAADRARRARPR